MTVEAVIVTSTENTHKYDYIVVGGGLAGGIAAARLAEEQAGSVLLLDCDDAAEQHPETLTSVSALNAPSMMIGYRAANFILEGTSS